jgi:hypothetical protein
MNPTQPNSLRCQPTPPPPAEIFPERGLAQAAAEPVAKGAWCRRTAFRPHLRCGLGRPALRFGCGFAALCALVALASSLPAAAQLTNAPAAAADYSSFRLVADRNIFDPNRRPHDTRSNRRQSASRSVPTFSFVGTMDYRRGRFAFFDGTDSDYRRALSTNGVIAGYTVAEITPTSVKLQSTNKSVELKIGSQMRQEAGAWQLIANEEWTPAATADNPTAAATPAADFGGEPNDVLKQLMQKREQELK